MPVELVTRRFGPLDQCASCGQGPIVHGEGHPFRWEPPIVASDGARDGASDLGSLPLVTDHAHEVENEGQEWARCYRCGLGAAAHARSIGCMPF